MLITTIEELRLALPTHAMDDVSQLSGFIENSEVDFLKEKLGDALYIELLDFYKKLDVQDYLYRLANNEPLNTWERILMLCQRVVSFDAMGRAVSVQAVSLNNAGVNVSVSDDYKEADKATVDAYKAQCQKEAHAGVNYLLQVLEGMACEVEKIKNTPAEIDAESGDGTDDDSTSSEEEKSDAEKELEAKKKIVELWSMSRYFFLVSILLIPTASILQDFVNIYDNREKFVQLLPDLHYVQEEQICPAIGEELVEYFVHLSVVGTDDKLLARLVYKLRRALASGLEARTTILNIKKERQMQAHDEFVGYMLSIKEYIQNHQAEFPKEAEYALKLSPCYKASEPVNMPPQPKAYENKPGNAIFAMPIMH